MISYFIPIAIAEPTISEPSTVPPTILTTIDSGISTDSEDITNEHIDPASSRMDSPANADSTATAISKSHEDESCSSAAPSPSDTLSLPYSPADIDSPSTTSLDDTEKHAAIDETTTMEDSVPDQSTPTTQPILEIDTVEESIDSYNYTPSSPLREEFDHDWRIPIIPLQHSTSTKASPTKSNVANFSIVDGMIKTYNMATNQIMHAEVASNKTPVIPRSIMQKLQNTMQRYLSSRTFTTADVDRCVVELLRLTQRPKFLAQTIMSSIQKASGEELCRKATSPAPLLRLTDKKCIVLVLRLTKHMPQFDEYLRMEIERQTFKLKDSLPFESLINQMYFHIALLDIDSGQPHKLANIRLLIYKCLYYYKRLSSALVYAILMAYPRALPHATHTTAYDDPLLRAFASVLANEIYVTDAEPFLMKQEMFFYLKIRYGYFALISFPFDDTVSYCIECIHRNQLKNVDYALILVGKRKGYEWAMKYIVEGHLVPLLGQFMANVHADAHDHQIATILFTIATIVKTVPCDQNIEKYLNMFASVMDATNRKLLQQAAVSALCQLARFSHTSVYSKIASWRPDYEVDRSVKAMLLTFVHKKMKSFWFDK